MARYAPVVPLDIAEGMLHHSQGDILGGYHLLLAHDVILRPAKYRLLYGPDSAVRRRHPDSFIIMDNSIVELGESVTIGQLLDACEIVRPDCLVIPDCMGAGEKTRQRFYSFIHEWSSIARVRRAESSYCPELMGVLQGNGVEDVMNTYLHMSESCCVMWYAVPRVYAQMYGSRMEVVTRLSGLVDGIHLLGFSDDLLDDVSCARMPHVMGIDSAVPVRAAMQKQQLNLNHNEDYGKRGDFWERTMPDIHTQTYYQIATNVVQYREWIKPRTSQLG